MAAGYSCTAGIRAALLFQKGHLQLPLLPSVPEGGGLAHAVAEWGWYPRWAKSGAARCPCPTMGRAVVQSLFLAS